MKRGIIRSIKDFLGAIPEFLDEKVELSESTAKLLKMAYEKTSNLPRSHSVKSIKPPLIVSFHPKVSLLNNNVHEMFLAEKVASKLGMMPLWIPYVYDTGYKTAANKIRLPTYVYFEGKFIPLRASAKIRGNITATEKPITEKEVKTFFSEIEKHELSRVTHLKGMLNPFNFGHNLFDIKRNLTAVNRKSIRKRVGELEKKWLKAIEDADKLSESLANISIANLKEFGINIGLLMMDKILSDAVKTVFSEVIECKSIKKDPSIIENLFLSYNLKNKERNPILYAGDNRFIGFDEYDVKVFDGSLDDLVEGLREHEVLPTGHLIMTLFTAMGCKLVLGGTHTLEYYPDYFEKAYSILNETSFNSKMNLLCYGNLRFMDIRNIYDVLSTVRVLDKVGSRNYIKSGQFKLPDAIIDHLNFLTGTSGVPSEYITLLDKILKKTMKKKPKKSGEKSVQTKTIQITALEKEQSRHLEIGKILQKKPDDLLKNPSSLIRWIKGAKFDGMHPIRLEVLLENLRLDADIKLRKIEENISFEQHILGGSIDDEEGEKIIYDGILKRSNRYPSLFEMIYYGCKPLKTFEVGGTFEEHESEWILRYFVQKTTKSDKIKTEVFKDYISVFERLIPNEILIPILKKLKK